MSTLFNSFQSSLLELPLPSEATQQTQLHEKSLKPNALSFEEHIEDDSTNSDCDTCSNHDNEEDCTSMNQDYIFSESGDSTAEDEEQA